MDVPPKEKGGPGAQRQTAQELDTTNRINSIVNLKWFIPEKWQRIFLVPDPAIIIKDYLEIERKNLIINQIQ